MELEKCCVPKMDLKESCILKDPMRDSLLSSDYEADVDISPPGSPAELAIHPLSLNNSVPRENTDLICIDGPSGRSVGTAFETYNDINTHRDELCEGFHTTNGIGARDNRVYDASLTRCGSLNNQNGEPLGVSPSTNHDLNNTESDYPSLRLEPSLVSEFSFQCRNESTPNDERSLPFVSSNFSNAPASWVKVEESWEGLGECEDIFRRNLEKSEDCEYRNDENLGNNMPVSNRGDILTGGSLSNGPDSLDTQQSSDEAQPDSLQPELEFDYWQGQFEFCSPALQDCSFVPGNLSGGLHPEADNKHESGLPTGNVYKDLINMVKILQGKVEVLGDNHNDSQDRIVRVKQDNSVLQARVVMLEEQTRDTEHRAEEKLAEEQRRNRELIQRIEREKTLTVENYSIKQVHLEKNNERLEEEVSRLKGKVERHQKERNDLEDRVLEAEQAANALREEGKKLAGQTKREQQEDIDRSNTIISELRSEVERLTGLLESKTRVRIPSTDSMTANTDHLSAALKTCKEENRSLEEQVEELQAQLLSKNIETGRELVIAAPKDSLAAEFEAMSQDEDEQETRETLELRMSVREAQEVNKNLRTYIDGILLTIVENYPQLLEVKHKPA